MRLSGTSHNLLPILARRASTFLAISLNDMPYSYTPSPNEYVDDEQYFSQMVHWDRGVGASSVQARYASDQARLQQQPMSPVRPIVAAIGIRSHILGLGIRLVHYESMAFVGPDDDS